MRKESPGTCRIPSFAATSVAMLGGLLSVREGAHVVVLGHRLLALREGADGVALRQRLLALGEGAYVRFVGMRLHIGPEGSSCDVAHDGLDRIQQASTPGRIIPTG